VSRSRSRVEATEAELHSTERALADAEVRAPFSGLVADRLVSVGEYVQAGQALVELVALDPIEVEFHLPEVDSSRVRLGQSVFVGVAPFPDEQFIATVSFIAPTINPNTRTLRVKATIDNKDHRLRPGLFARSDLGVNHRKDVVLVSERAVLQRADGAVVFRLADDGTVERRVVELGSYRNGRIEVITGLEAKDRVVVRGQTVLVDGSRVAIRNNDGTTPTPAVASGPSEPSESAKVGDEGNSK